MTSVPKSIGVILDGNRRWAKSRNLPSLQGHRRGADKVKDLMLWSSARGIKELVLYAFSTENWNRSEEEVAHLMSLFDAFVEECGREARSRSIRIRFIGERSRFSQKFQAAMDSIEHDTSAGTNGTVVFALSYGGRAEILSAVNALLEQGAKEATEADFSRALWSAGILDPDMIIRTGGEKRLSNFLTWQSVYSELFFTDTMLPDLSEAEFDSMLEDYASRERRRGK